MPAGGGKGERGGVPKEKGEGEERVQPPTFSPYAVIPSFSTRVKEGKKKVEKGRYSDGGGRRKVNVIPHSSFLSFLPRGEQKGKGRRRLQEREMGRRADSISLFRWGGEKKGKKGERS